MGERGEQLISNPMAKLASHQRQDTERMLDKLFIFIEAALAVHGATKFAGCLRWLVKSLAPDSMRDGSDELGARPLFVLREPSGQTATIAMRADRRNNGLLTPSVVKHTKTRIVQRTSNSSMFQKCASSACLRFHVSPKPVDHNAITTANRGVATACSSTCRNQIHNQKNGSVIGWAGTVDGCG